MRLDNGWGGADFNGDGVTDENDIDIAGQYWDDSGPLSFYDAAVSTGLQLAGDFDADGDADGDDFLTWQRGGSPSPFRATNLDDWQANFGSGVSTMAATSATVPEPSALSLLVFTLVEIFRAESRTMLCNHHNFPATGSKGHAVILRVCFAFSCCLSPCCLASQPNIVLILADDLGYADVGFNGSKDIRTPWIDRIATGGVRCTSGYAPHSFCSPSRAGILTGRYQHRFGHERNPIFAADDPNMGMPVDQQTLADVLQNAGYATGIIGKWHLGAHPRFHPLNRGFDFFYGMLGGGHQYFPEKLTINDPTRHQDSYFTRLLRNRERVDETEYLTDAFSREAVSFIEQNAERPFFLFLSYNAPHAPLQATDEYLDRYPEIADDRRRIYAAMVTAIDEGVGKVLNSLKASGLSEQTLVFFMSDNGGPLQANASNNYPLRGKKGGMNEGGIRVPFAVRWDGVLPAGIDFDPPVSGLDIFATAIAAAKVQPPADQSLDGVDLVPYFAGDRSDPPHKLLFWRQSPDKWRGRQAGGYAVRSGNMKFLQNAAGQQTIYDLEQDIQEKHNLSDEQDRALQSLITARDQWDSELMPPRFLGIGQQKEYGKLRDKQ